MQTEKFEFQAEMRQLMHLIIHSLYTHKEVFLREVISNSSDALNKLRVEKAKGESSIASPDLPLQIKIEADKDKKQLVISDTGIGMTKEELVNRLGMIAGSGTREFLQAAAENKGKMDANLIGQFGVGFYAVFMVAERVTVDSRPANPDEKAHTWISDGEGEFTVVESAKQDRGTTITLTLREDDLEFADDMRIKQIIKKYSNFVDFPIVVGDDQENNVGALWHRPKEEVTEEEWNEFYKFVSSDYREPLDRLLISIEGRVNFKAVVFIPAEAPPALYRLEDRKSLHLYTNRVFIQDDATEILPEYLSFVKGIVDTEDLPLNVSREVTQNSPIMVKMRELLTTKILGHLKSMLNKDREKYTAFFQQFGGLFKTGLNSEFTHRDKMLDLLMYETQHSEPGQLQTLQEIIDSSPEDQDQIVYVTAESRKAALQDPYIEAFDKKGWTVVLLTDPVDAFTTTQIGEYKEYKVVAAEHATLAEHEVSEEQTQELEGVVAKFKAVLGEEVADVQLGTSLVSAAVSLKVAPDGMDRRMEQMMKAMDKNFTGGQRVLEINPDHPLIVTIKDALNNDEQNGTIDALIQQLYLMSRLNDGNFDRVGETVSGITELLTASIASK